MNVFSVLIFYYYEEVIYLLKDFNIVNEDGIIILFYLQRVFFGLILSINLFYFKCIFISVFKILYYISIYGQ